MEQNCSSLGSEAEGAKSWYLRQWSRGSEIAVLWAMKLDLFIFTIFYEGDIVSSTAGLPYGPLNIWIKIAVF